MDYARGETKRGDAAAGIVRRRISHGWQTDETRIEGSGVVTEAR
jgi:hypothetical protein